MKAVVFNGPGDVELKDVPTPEPGPGEVLLKVGSNTVCGTDVRFIKGVKTGVKPGTVLGHEVAGTVAQVGAGVSGYEVGDIGAVLPGVTCGSCRMCRRGKEQFCVTGFGIGVTVNGGLAEYVLIPERAVSRGNLCLAAPGTDMVGLSLVEPLSCVLNGFDNYGVDVGDTAVILGGGPIGLLHLTVIKLAGARRVIVSDPSESRRRVAESVGADLTVDPKNQDLQEVVMDVTDGLGADLVVVAIGVPQLFADALGLVRIGGRVNAFAGFPKGETVAIDPNLIHYREIAVSGASDSGRRQAERALELVERGLVPTEVIVSDTYPLSQALEGIDYYSSGKGTKVAVVPD